MQYKVIDNILYWFNKEKWLVMETCLDNEEALALKAELESRE